MSNIKIGGVVHLTINDDPTRVISFNPSDLGFADRVYNMKADMEERETEYRRRAAALDTAGGDFRAGLAMLRELCEDMKGRIDTIFGRGTSAAAFGDMLDPAMFAQFFEGVAPYIEQARKSKTGKYIAAAKGSGVLRKEG